jgi:AcrR family transcriptional regulator
MDERGDPRVLRTRRKVLEAVRAVMLAEGPAAVTHQRIAALAGVARATMYLHWPEPGQLLLDALTETPIPQTVPETGNLRGDLVNALGVVRALLVQPAMVAVFLQLLARAESDPVANAARRELNTRSDTAILSLLATVGRQGRLVIDDPDDAIAQLVGPLIFRRIVQALPIDDHFTTKVVDAFLADHAHRDLAPAGDQAADSERGSGRRGSPTNRAAG